MLRDGVPPHIGQSVVPAMGAPSPRTAAVEAARMTPPARANAAVVRIGAIVSVHLYVVERRAPRRVGVEARAARLVPLRVDCLDEPGGRLGLAARPRLAAHARGAVLLILHFELDAVPGVALPGERRRLGHLDVRLPRLELD